MRSILIAALLCAAGVATAQDLVARNGSDYVRLQSTPCAEPVLSLVPEPVRGLFHAAVAQVDGKEYAACWALRPDGMVHVVYSDGDHGLVPGAQFRRQQGI